VTSTDDRMQPSDSERLLGDRRTALVLAVVLWAIAGAFALALAIQGSADWLQSIDDRVYTYVVENEVGSLAWLGEFLGVFGSVVVMGPLMIGVAVFLGVKHRWSALTVWISAVTVSQLVSITMKNLYGRPRPPFPLVETTSFSFPSGHAITGAVFAIGLMIVLVPPARRRPVYWVVAIIYIIAMAWSRVYVRAHWLSDVSAGVAIGAGVVVCAALLTVWIDGRQHAAGSVDGRRS
jgi:membrane-associated phospholipid phosphatase